MKEIYTQVELYDKFYDLLGDMEMVFEDMDPLQYAIDMIEDYPVVRIVEFDCHGTKLKVNPLDIYANCPKCSSRVKIRAFSSYPSEVQDLLVKAKEWLDSANEELAKQLILQYAAAMPNKKKWDHLITVKNLDTLRNRWKMLREVANFAMSDMLDKMEKDFPEEDYSTFEEINQ